MIHLYLIAHVGDGCGSERQTAHPLQATTIDTEEILMKLLTGLMLSILLAGISHADSPHYIKASIQIAGEFSADATIMLQAGKPAKIQWHNEGADYALLIPDVSMNSGVPNVFGMLLKETNDQQWQVLTEANSIGNQFSLLGLLQGNQLLSITATSVSKEEFEQGCQNIALESGPTIAGHDLNLAQGPTICCTRQCTNGSGTITCCGGCCSDGVCGNGCCPEK